MVFWVCWRKHNGFHLAYHGRRIFALELCLVWRPSRTAQWLVSFALSGFQGWGCSDILNGKVYRFKTVQYFNDTDHAWSSWFVGHGNLIILCRPATHCSRRIIASRLGCRVCFAVASPTSHLQTQVPVPKSVVCFRCFLTFALLRSAVQCRRFFSHSSLRDLDSPGFNDLIKQKKTSSYIQFLLKAKWGMN